MRRIVAVLLAATGCGPALSPPGDAERAGEVVRVATWNVHDLFDSEDRTVPPGALDEVPQPAEVEAKLERVAAVLLRLDADLVLLQEVENLPLLERLASFASYPTACLVEGNDPRGIDVAVLSRLPLTAYRSHLGDLASDGTPLWPRDCVEAHAEAFGRRLVVVGSHLSSALSDGGARRAEQAARMREIADGLTASEPDSLVLAGGDLNDSAAGQALVPLLGDGEWVDQAPPGALTWIGSSGSGSLDHLAVEAASVGAVLGGEVLSGTDVDAASDHRPVVVALWVE